MAKNKGKAVEPLVSPEIKRVAAQRARDKAMNARWDLNIAIFLFAVLILVIILVRYTTVGIEIVATIASYGLAMVWLVGWQRGKQLYERFYKEELAILEAESKRAAKIALEETIEKAVEAQVQKALGRRWQR
ncbi:MAG: hypothetical protein HYX80_06795 [Chloroflexi bacterium]|nr:hypothetical protein [Chloroflexota bacterium]